MVLEYIITNVLETSDFSPIIKCNMMVMRLISLMFTFYQILIEDASEKSYLNNSFKFNKFIAYLPYAK